MRLFESDCPQQLMTEMRLQERRKRQEEVKVAKKLFFKRMEYILLYNFYYRVEYILSHFRMEYILSNVDKIFTKVNQLDQNIESLTREEKNIGGHNATPHLAKYPKDFWQ